MAGPLLLSVEQHLTNVKSEVLGQSTTPAPPPPTLTEVFAPITDSLSGLLSGGAHPEAMPAIVNKSATLAGDNTAGPHGGAVPRPTSVEAPGPAGTVAGLRARLKAKTGA